MGQKLTCRETIDHAELGGEYRNRIWLMSFWRTGMLGLALLLLAAILDASAQPVPVIGYVAAKNANPKRLEVFRQGLTELGYVEGKNLLIEYREAVFG
jgi:putative tryptophan/tyrosine transport system substrate-binding protein